MTLRELLPTDGEPFSDIFGLALRGLPCSVIGLAGGPLELPVHIWREQADEADHELLEHCVGRTLDIGCGPGRLSAALVARGHEVLGVDVVGEAVAQTRERGASALCRDVFEELPGEGRWRTALLADGNLGIGGDPEALLVRARSLIESRGRVVVEIDGPGVPRSTEWAILECEGLRSRPFRWAIVGTDSIRDVASAAGFTQIGVHPFGDRWCAVLEP